MDIICPKCAEPTDPDYFHDVARDIGSTYQKVASAFRLVGCKALGEHHNPNGSPSPVAQAMYDLLGDDMDGAASMLDDFR